MAEYLRVHQVAEAYEAADESDGDDETVECPQRTPLRGEYREKDDAEDDAYRAAVTCESALPHRGC